MLLKSIKVNKDIKLDFFHYEEKSVNNVDIFATKKYKPVLGNDSRFLITFDDGTTTSKGIANISLGYTFSVYKDIKGSDKLIYVAKIKDGGLSVKDYAVQNNTTYKYFIFKESESSISEAVVSNEVTTCWEDWSIVDLIPSSTDKNTYHADPELLWKLNLNLSSSDVSQAMDSTVYQNFTKFPKISVGEQNYSSGSITCLLGKIRYETSKYYEPIDLLNKWNDFCANGNVKLLKDRRGNIRLVMINGTSSKVDDVTVEQPTTITFNWVEIDEINNITVIE